MSKKLLTFILIFFGILLFSVSFFLLSKDLSPTEQNAEVLPIKTKKWNPGHYLQGANDITPSYITENLNAATSANLKGIRVPLYWGEWETSKDVYDFKILDSYINALPSNKKILIKVHERDYWGRYCNEGARLPNYIMDENQPHPALTLPGAGCVAQFWEPDIQARWIKALTMLAKHVENNDKVEMVIFSETAFGFPDGFDGSVSEFKLLTRDAFINIHKGIAPAFQKTQVMQAMNHLGPNCQYLDLMADELMKLGHGLANPDSPPQDSLPWDCNASSDAYQTFYKLTPKDNPKPVYAVFRRVKGKMPIMVGGDTSQFGDPERPKIFNGEPLNYDNLVKYLYLTAVKGYTYSITNPDKEVTPHGANYMLWNTHFNSIEAQRNFPDNPISSAEYTRKYKDAYAKFLSNQNNTTIKTCPSNINCIGNVNISVLPTASSITPVVSPLTTPKISITITATPTIKPVITNTVIPSNTPPVPSDTILPSNTPFVGKKCGKADIDGDSVFKIGDLSEFARMYGNGKNVCEDTTQDHLSYGLCGGRDVNKDGILNIADFGGAGIGFAQRYYPKTSCAL
jgi:hypothetical protein